jgi:hypothetical protein
MRVEVRRRCVSTVAGSPSIEQESREAALRANYCVGIDAGKTECGRSKMVVVALARCAAAGR